MQPELAKLTWPYNKYQEDETLHLGKGTIATSLFNFELLSIILKMYIIKTNL